VCEILNEENDINTNPFMILLKSFRAWQQYISNRREKLHLNNDLVERLATAIAYNERILQSKALKMLIKHRQLSVS